MSSGSFRRFCQAIPVVALVVSLFACDAQNTADSLPDIAAAKGQPGYVAIRVDATSFSGKDERWYLTNADNIPDVAPDPDPPHHATAQGSGYLELLPDTRVSHGDELQPYVNYWADTPKGPKIYYTLDIPVPGRYYVWVKALSTGTEDNGIHVGFDNQKPLTGKRIQWCGRKDVWAWSSAQRVPENHCGVPKTIYLDIPTAGAHDIVFYAREDGFEIDQFVLLKDPADGEHDCAVHNDGIRCKNISTGKFTGTYDIGFSAPDDSNVIHSNNPFPGVEIDLDIKATATTTQATVGEEISYLITASNVSVSDIATSVKITADLPTSIEFGSSSDCTANNRTVVCNVADMLPGDSNELAFSATPSKVGTSRVDFKIQADQNDVEPSNDTLSVTIDVAPDIPLYDAHLDVLISTNTIGHGSSATHLLIARNVGREPITDATLEISEGSFSVRPDLDSCTTSDITRCTLDPIAPDETIEIPLILSTEEPEISEAIYVELAVSADEDLDNNIVEIMMRSSKSDTIALANGELALEAEDFAEQLQVGLPERGEFNSAWFVVSELVAPKIVPDFDNTASETASSGAYMELLPDTRINNSDPIVDGHSNFTNALESPQLVYPVFFSEAGTYVINARIRANNDQDSIVHVGLDNDWPASAAYLSNCNPNGDWVWVKTRSVNGQCDPETEATIEIPHPGHFQISVAAGTDGVEIDKLIIKPAGGDSPVDFGGDPAIFSPVAIDLSITSDYQDGVYSVTVHNPNQNNPAIDIAVTVNGFAQTPGELKGFDECSTVDNTIDCTIISISPNSSITARLVVAEDSDDEIRAALSQPLDPNVNNNETVTQSGGGIFNPLLILMLSLGSIAISRLQRVNTRYRRES